MSASAVLAELDAAGVTLTRNGDQVHYRTRPGVSIAPYRSLIAANKAALLAELIRAEILAAVSVEPEHFDRARYDELWSRLYALGAEAPFQPSRNEHDAVMRQDRSV